SLEPCQAAIDVERTPGLQGDDRVQLPSAQQVCFRTVFEEWQIPQSAEGEAVPHVEFRGTMIGGRLVDILHAGVCSRGCLHVEVVAEIAFGYVIQYFAEGVVGGPGKSVSVSLPQ